MKSITKKKSGKNKHQKSLLPVYCVLFLTLIAFPTLAKTFTPRLLGHTAGEAFHAVSVSGSYAYVAAGNALAIFNVSNPGNPALTGRCDTPGSARGVYVSGSTAYVADGYSGLQIIGISNPKNPILLGSYDTSGFAAGVHVSGKTAYVADYGNGL
ncbi:MAG: hypothetical protein HYW14_02905, partial [Planctomycetes bacterium]|nr:hypothetical protein [Planctomycetota bacterium]